jgi:YHS domain-containing protein
MRISLITAVAASVLATAGCETLSPSAGARTAASANAADRVLVNRDRNGLALQGYDPVAYFTRGMPTKGSEALTARHDGATYRFATAENRAAFLAEPDRYAPAYGGYCGYAASINRLSPIDPEFWQIVDGRLVLQHNKKASDLWNKDVADSTVKADANWPGLVAKNGSTVKVLVNTDDAGLALEGYDPITYFSAAQPVKGDPRFMAVYNGATYRFVSMENRVAFESDPARYAPAFGGYCGYAASINKISPVNPMIYQIIDGRLVLQHTDEAYRLFNKNPERSLARADMNWPRLVERKGS